MVRRLFTSSNRGGRHAQGADCCDRVHRRLAPAGFGWGGGLYFCRYWLVGVFYIFARRLRSVPGLARTVHSHSIADVLRLGYVDQRPVSFLFLQYDRSWFAVVFCGLHQSAQHRLDSMDGLALADAHHRKLFPLENGESSDPGITIVHYRDERRSADSNPGRALNGRTNQRLADCAARFSRAIPSASSGLDFRASKRKPFCAEIAR